MQGQPCPHCEKPTISWWEKYKAAKWGYIYCPECEGRICSNPYILVFYTIMYVWDVLFFVAMAHFKENAWILIGGVIGWIILDIFSLYLPLSALKAKIKAKPS